MTSDDDPGWLARRLLGDPGLLAEVLAEAREETMLGDLRAREVLAIRLGFDRVRDLTAIDYGHAFRALARAGDDEAARALAAVAMAAQLLPGHSMEWIARYESRPLTRAQRDALEAEADREHLAGAQVPQHRLLACLGQDLGEQARVAEQPPGQPARVVVTGHGGLLHRREGGFRSRRCLGLAGAVPGRRRCRRTRGGRPGGRGRRGR